MSSHHSSFAIRNSFLKEAQMIHTWLDVNSDASEAVRTFLRSLMDKGVVEAILVPLPLPGGENVVHNLVVDPQKLSEADPLAPV